MLVVIDCGFGNVGSVINALRHLDCSAVQTSDRRTVSDASRIILPGVGSFDRAVNALQSQGLWDLLDEKIRQRRTPILGICLGMQLFARRSEEGSKEGFGWINGDVLRLDSGIRSIRVPHVGWNHVRPRANSFLFRGLESPIRAYFVHSYHFRCDHDEDIAGITEYGSEMVSAVEHGNVFGTQFHPEKSQGQGIRILKNFLDYEGCRNG